MNMSDRIAIMNHGRIEQVGRPDDIYENPDNTFVARFLGEANLLEGLCEQTADGFGTLRLPSGHVIRARTGAARIPSAGAAAHCFVRPERVRLDGASRSAPSEAARAGHVVRLQGRLARTAFLGNILRHDVEVAPGTGVTVDEHNLGDRTTRAPGDEVTLEWRPEDALLLAS